MSQRDTSNDVNYDRHMLKEFMDKYEFSVSQLADYLGMTDQAIVYWLTGKRKIPEPMGRLLNFFDQPSRVHLMKEF